MLELLVVLARALAFEMDDPADIWFWHLIDVMDLARFNDLEYDDEAAEIVAQTLDRIIWRRYNDHGQGGLFPLRDPVEDQRDVELWYQLNAYLIERY